MEAAAVTCPWCGAPLPERALKESASQPFVACEYCRATSNVADGRAARVQPGAASPLRLFSDEDFSREVAAAFRAARERGASAHDALVAAAHAKLGAMHGEAFARVCLALARDFDAANGTDTANDAACIARMTNAYLLAIESIRTSGTYKASMPFFTVSPQGLPVHFERTLTAEVIAELAQRSPSPPPPPPPVAPPQPPKKKRVWPFG